MYPKNFLIKFSPLILLIAGVILFTTCTKRIDPGFAGIEVDLYGGNKGVQSYSLRTGMVFYNPLTTMIVTYPVFVQTAIWTRSVEEGKAANEEITFNSKEGLVITGDVNLSYQLDEKMVPEFYVKFRQDNLDHFTHGIMRNLTRDAFNEEAVNFSVEELYGVKKEEFLNNVKARVNNNISVYGIKIEQFGFVGALRIPENVINALNAKIEATQNAIKAENVLRQTEAEAQQQITRAKGASEANRLLTSSISQQLIEWRRLEINEKALAKWNGAVPEVMSGTTGNNMILQLPGLSGK
jgi:regulator of protease activity HflC (stomatin/prohibitin superfamily)